MRLSGLKSKLFHTPVNLKKLLIISFFATSMTALIIVSAFNYFYSLRTVSVLTRENFSSIINKTTQIADERLSVMESNSSNMNVNTELFDIFSKDEINNNNVLSADRLVSSIIQRYSQDSQGVSSVFLNTSYYNFGNVNNKITLPESIVNVAKDTKGKFSWLPTYSVTKSTDCIFAGVRQMNLTYEYNGSYQPLNSTHEKPIFIAYYNYNFFDDLFEGSLPIDGCIYMVVDNDNQIIYDSDTSMLGKSIQSNWFTSLKKTGTLSHLVKINGKKYFTFIKRSEITQWYILSLAPYNEALQTMRGQILLNFGMVALLVILLAVITGYLFSNQITAPITNLISAIKKSSKGNFTAHLSSSKIQEVNQLISTYNSMNKMVDKLINDNYESQIREKDALLASLTSQLNPHFLYNTFNIINWIAIENNQDEISDMIVSLSQMLQYSARTGVKIVKFSDDLSWVKNYIKIMKIRYNNKFEVIYDIDEKSLDVKVPKLMIQPFIENIFVHAFKDLKSDGLINIKAHTAEDTCAFEIIDNGCGMDQNTVQQIISGQSSRLGLVNVMSRLKIVYGRESRMEIESQPGIGTRVVITLPLNY